MTRMVGIVLGIGALAMFGAGCGVDPGSSTGELDKKDKKECEEEPCEEEEPVPCRVTGGGQILWGTGDDEVDSFGGNAQPFPRRDDWGEWNHVTHEGRHFVGDPLEIECGEEFNDEEPPAAGADTITFRGVGTFDGEDCTFTVYIEDHGEPSARADAPSFRTDYYQIDIDCEGTEDDYFAGDWLYHGNLQLHEVPPGHL